MGSVIRSLLKNKPGGTPSSSSSTRITRRQWDHRVNDNTTHVVTLTAMAGVYDDTISLATPSATVQSADITNQQVLDGLKSIYVDATTTTQTIDNPYKKNIGGVKLSIGELVEMIEREKTSDVESLSAAYKVNAKDVSNILKYFGNYYAENDGENKREKVELKFHPLHR